MFKFIVYQLNLIREKDARSPLRAPRDHRGPRFLSTFTRVQLFLIFVILFVMSQKLPGTTSGVDFYQCREIEQKIGRWRPGDTNRLIRHGGGKVEGHWISITINIYHYYVWYIFEMSSNRTWSCIEQISIRTQCVCAM